MDKERVRNWLRQRSRERAPLPPIEQIRQALGWSRPPQPASDAALQPRPRSDPLRR